MFCTSLRQRRDLASAIPFLTSAQNPVFRGYGLHYTQWSFSTLTENRINACHSRYCIANSKSRPCRWLTAAVISRADASVHLGQRTAYTPVPHRTLRYSDHLSETSHCIPSGQQLDTKFQHLRLSRVHHIANDVSDRILPLFPRYSKAVDNF